MIQPVKSNTASPLKHLTVILLLLLACSCSAAYKNLTYENSGLKNKIELLSKDLSGLSDKTDTIEAERIAETGIKYSLELADEYKLVRPPWFHNFLVQTGIKKRGLCYQWADDLKKKLTTLGLRNFDIHLGTSYKGNYFREHNCVVITAAGQDFEKGIVLDAWRNSGDLYWAPVKTDKYPWKKLILK